MVAAPHVSKGPDTPAVSPTPSPALDGRGPKPKPTEVKVNNRPVTVPDDEVTGLQVKQAAINAGLPIDLGFQLLLDEPNGRDRPVGDHDTVKVNKRSQFTAIAADDNS